MENIIKALEDIKGQGSFCTSRTMSVECLQVKIEGFGLLRFPLTEQDVKTLIWLAKPAKFGWRDQTLLDKKVRDSWEIPKKVIKIENHTRHKKLNSILDLIKSDLGLPETSTLKGT